MTLVVGIDPGAYGAFAVYDTASREITEVHDMPVWFMSVNKTKRARVDVLAVSELFDWFSMLGVSLVVLEAVSGGSSKGTSNSFAFGYGVGVVAAAAILSKIPLETVPPTKWKKLLDVPGKTKATPDDIMARGLQMFPKQRDLFYGPKGGKLVDRMEAAMLAKVGGDYVLRDNGEDKGDVELRLAYRNGGLGS